jgi:CheY-like chemotaxis protein
METKKILVVDDQKPVCESVRKILSRRGHQVDEALSAEEALRKIDASPDFALVIADMMMPQVSGLDLIKLIKDRYPEIGVVIITGYASIATAVKAMKLGAIEYVPKPFTPDELTDVTERAILKVIEQRLKKKAPEGPVEDAATEPAPAAQGERIDVDLPFDEKALRDRTSPDYVDHLTRSDIPTATVHVSKSYCPIGNMNCKKYETKGACKGECPILVRRAKEAAAAETQDEILKTIGKGYIDVDLPFDAYELAKATSPEYMECLSRSDMPIVARWRRPALEEAQEQPAHRVLVVDDEPVVCNSVRKILSPRGFRVEHALDPDDAIRKVDLQEFDLVILDYKLPRMNGLELMRRFKAVYPDLPIVMITGYASIPSAIDAVKEGAFEYLPKPFTPGELLAAARQACDRIAA